MNNLSLLFLLSIFLTSEALCQTGTDGPAGEFLSKAYGAYDAQGFDSINLDNGRPIINIPIFSYPQRGSHIKAGMHLTYSPAVLQMYYGTFSASAGMDIVPDFDFPLYIDAWGHFGAYYLESSTGTHILVPTVGRTTYMAADGSGYQMPGVNSGGVEPTMTGSIIDRDGNIYHDGMTTQNGAGYGDGITDVDGNHLSINASPGNPNSYLTGWTDTMGRQITYPEVYDESNLQYNWPESIDPNTGEGIRTWTVPGLSGGSATYTFKYDEQGYINAPCVLGAATNLNCMTITQGTSTGFDWYGLYTDTGGARITALQYPDGTSWKFAYDLATSSDNITPHYGDLTQVTTPLGATISYQWDVMPQFATVCSSFAYNTTNPSFNPRTIVTRTVSLNDGSSPQVWHYKLTPVNSGAGSISVPGEAPTGSAQYAAYAMVVTDPGGNQTVHVFEPVDGICQYYETQTLIYQNSQWGQASLLNKIETTYYHGNTHFTGGTVFDTIWKNSSKDYNSYTVYEQWANGPVSSEMGYAYEPIFMNAPTAVRTTDLVSGTSIETDISYAWQTDSSYLDAGLFSTPTSVTKFNINPSTGVQTQIKQSTISYDEPSYILSSGVSTQRVVPTQPKRGLPTTVTEWRNTDGATIPLHLSWYDTGMLAQRIDSSNVPLATISYSSVYTGAYPTEVDDALGHPTRFTYDFNTGTRLTSADANMIAAGQQITYNYFLTGTFSAGRLKSITYPSGQETFNYPNANTVQASVTADSGTFQTQSISDGLGRTVDSQILNVPTSPVCSGGVIHQVTSYDFAGRVAGTSKPYCSTSDPTYDVKWADYDPLGRLVWAGWLNDNHNGSDFSYPSANVQVEDTGGGYEFIRTFDGMGHLIDVLEPGDQERDGDTPTQETQYGYDGLGNLITVNQLGDSMHSPADLPRVRSFTYNSLSQLVSSHNPESGNQQYTYDLHGNVLTTTDARNITTLLCYDIGDRLLSMSTSDTSCPSGSASANPFVTLSYDAALGQYSQANLIGRLSGVSAAAGASMITEAYSYDSLGRDAAIFEQLPSDTAGNFHTTAMTYTPLGNLKQLTYPSGRTVLYQWDAANRLLSAQDTTGGTSGQMYFSNPVYYGDGSLYGSSIANSSVTSTVTRDSQSRPREWSSSSTTVGRLSDLVYGYDDHHPGYVNGIADALHPNPSYYKSYSYDSLNRLTSFSAVTASGSFSQMYSYDPFGNLLQSNNTNMPSPQPPPASYGADNKLGPGYTNCLPAPSAIGVDGSNPAYDRAGNMLCDGTTYAGVNSDHQYTYDSVGRLAQMYQHFSLAATYTYSGEGNRVRKDVAGGNFTEYVWVGGEVLGERSSTGGGMWTDYIYVNGQKIAKIAPATNVLHLSGSNVAGSGSVASGVDLSGLNGTTIQSGDVLSLWQYTVAENGAAGGIWLGFVGGDYSTSGSRGWTGDQDGQGSNMDGIIGQWHHRSIDLSAFTGLTVNRFLALDERNGAVGQFDEYFADVAVHRADGTIIPVWTGTPAAASLTATVFGPGIATAQVDGLLPSGTDSIAEVSHFYLHDSLGTSQMELSSGGWPIWQGTFSPFGQELDQSPTTMHYKFTGKERDAESGLDNFGARYLTSSLGRWTSPDPSGEFFADPRNPQSLNLYGYAQNSPVNKIDPDGLLTIVIGGTFSNIGRNNRRAWGDGNPLMNQARRHYGDPVYMYAWTSWDTDLARRQGAAGLRDYINSYHFKLGEKLTVIGHSHGGNVALMAAALGLNHKIDRLITLGTPFGYAKRSAGIVDWYNITGSGDQVQPTFSQGCGAGTAIECSYQEGADNYTVHDPGGHTDLWSNSSVTDQWWAYVTRENDKDDDAANDSRNSNRDSLGLHCTPGPGCTVQQ